MHRKKKGTREQKAMGWVSVTGRGCGLKKEEVEEDKKGYNIPRTAEIKQSMHKTFKIMVWVRDTERENDIKALIY